MELCLCAWRLTLKVSSMDACGATAGNVKRLLPPRQSRGISFVSLGVVHLRGRNDGGHRCRRARSNRFRRGLDPTGRSRNLCGLMIPPCTKSRRGTERSVSASMKFGVAPSFASFWISALPPGRTDRRIGQSDIVAPAVGPVLLVAS
jgi:hypothetical protein